MNKPSLWVCAFDLHYPLVSWKTFAAMMDFVKHTKPDGFLFGGDQFDNSEISHHNADKPIFKPRGAFKRNEKEFDQDILRPIEKAIGNDAERVWIIGNHDIWEKQMDERSPELEGCFDRVQNLKLRERDWEIVENGKARKIGKLNVIHGDQLFNGYGSLYPTRRALDIYMRNVLFGHVHYAQSYCKVSPIEDREKLMAWSSPCLCETNPLYSLNKPNAWVNGFTVVEVMGTGNFNVTPIVVTDGAFSYGGKVYGK